MLNWRSKSSPLPHPSIPAPPGFLARKTAAELLEGDGAKRHITMIKQSIGATKDAWVRNYQYAIEQTALFAQEFPASLNHHHAYQGGLLEHLLDATSRGIRLSKAHMLPPAAEPEKYILEGERWRFGVMLACLCHDLGKIIADLEVVYTTDGKQTSRWSAWHGPLPESTFYAFRRAPRSGENGEYRDLHELASATLLPHLLSPRASQWIQADSAMMRQLLGAIAYGKRDSGVIARIMKESDGASVKSDIAEENQAPAISNASPGVHQQIIAAIADMAQSREFKMNRPGASLWVTADDTWIGVSTGLKAVMENLRNKGIGKVPHHPSRLASLLVDHRLAQPTPDGNFVWKAQVDDPEANWSYPLAFVRITNELVWGSTEPPYFKGTVTPKDELDDKKASKTDEVKATENTSQDRPSDIQSHALHIEDQSPPESGSSAPPEQASPETPPSEDEPATDRGSPSIKGAPKETKSLNSANKRNKAMLRANDELMRRSDLMYWLLTGIANHRIQVNEPGALVHVIEGHVLLVTPSVFKAFIKKHPQKILSMGADEAAQIKSLQAAFKALKIHEKTSEGQDFHRVYIDGAKKKTAFSALVIDHNNLPGLAHFSANPVLRLP